MSSLQTLMYFQIKANFQRVPPEQRKSTLARLECNENPGIRRAAQELRQEHDRSQTKADRV